MQLAFFTDSYLPTRDGTAHVVDGLARTLAKRGHSVCIFAPRAQRGPTVREEEGPITVVRVRSHALPLYAQYRWPYAVSLALALRKERALKEADVVHLHTPGLVGTAGLFSGRHLRRPIVGTFHTHLRAMVESVRPQLGVRSFFRIAGFYSLGVYWRCDRTTAPTETARAALLEHATKPFRHPIEVVPNGIDLSRLRPGTAVPNWRARCGLPQVPLVTYLGRLTVDKGIHRFVDGVATALGSSEFVAIVGGTGPEEDTLRSRLERDPLLSSHVRYVGPVAEEEKAALLSQSDIFVLPSTSDTASVSLLEAMACETAVIGPATGGAADIIDDGVTGLRVASELPGALPGAIVRLLDDPGERRRLARAGRTRVVQNASLDVMATRFLALYEEVQSGAGGAPASV